MSKKLSFGLILDFEDVARPAGIMYCKKFETFTTKCSIPEKYTCEEHNVIIPAKLLRQSPLQVTCDWR
jgi:hypothetical protein